MATPSQGDQQKIKNGYLDTELEPMFETFEEMMRFMHQQFPPPPEPKEIKHVILDADDTIWQVDPWGIASLGIPIGRTEGDTLPIKLNAGEVKNVPEYWQPIAPTGIVKLDPKLRYTLKKLKERGIPVSIASGNDQHIIEKYLEAFGLRDQIADVEATFYASKDQMVKRIAKRQNVDSGKILFVDDNAYNCQDVERYTEATPLLLGYHIDQLDDLLGFIE